MKRFLIAWGIGGCWSGFTHAKIVEANGQEEADKMSIIEARKDREQQGLTQQRGCSAIAEPLTTTVEETGLFQSRLKESAKIMIRGKQNV